MRARLVAAALLALCCTLPRPVAAGQPEPLTLRWSVAPGLACPDEREVARALAGPSASLDGPALHASVRIYEDAHAGLRAALELERAGQRDTRELVAGHCSALAEAVLLVIALARADAPVPLQPPADARPVVRPLGALTLALGTGVDTGSLPRATPVLSAELGAFVARRAWLGLGLAYYVAHDQRIDDGASVRFGLISGVARACHALLGEPRHIAFAPCLFVEAGRASAHARGLDGVRDARRAQVSAGPALRLGSPAFGPLRAVLSLDLALRMRAATYAVEGLGTVHRSDPVVLRVAFSLELAQR